MNCVEVKNNLSAYWDRELPENASREIDAHLAACDSCRDELQTFASLSNLITRTPAPEVPGDAWARIEAAIEDRTGKVDVRPSAGVRRSRAGRLALAAGLLAVVTGAAIWYQRAGGGSQLQSAPQLAQYASLLSRDPAAAQQSLLAAYQGRAVAPDEAARVLGYVPVSLRRSPAGYRLRSAYLLDMPCCRCMQAVYEGGDGQTVAVFEKSPDHPLEFGDRPSVCTECNGQPCQLTQADSRLIVSCQVENRQLAIVGVRNMDEAHALLAWLQENSRLET